MHRQKITDGADDSSSYFGSAVVGLILLALYVASRNWLSESAFFCIAITVLLLYLVTGPFRAYWATPRFWGALFVLFGGHAVLLRWYVQSDAVHWSFWRVMVLGVPEALAMILILGWIVRDNYFTRNTRRERER